MRNAAAVARTDCPILAARLDVKHVSHAYSGHAVLHDISLHAEPGEIVAVLGPSGCGKSTLLRIVAGVERQSSGSLLLDGHCVANERVFHPPEDRSVGLIFQDYALFPHMTVLANVMFGLRGLKKGEAAGLARNMLQRVGLAHYADSYPGLLSGGEQQRVALARALAPRPRILLMDEPFSGLDRRLRDSVREEALAVLKETRITCLFVTHDPEEAMRIADRIVLMRGGRIAQTGTPLELYSRPRDLETARFFSEINEIPAIVKDGRARSALGEFAAPGLRDGQATLAVRPQAIGLCSPERGIAAGIMARQFLGEVVELELAVSGLEAPLRARLRANGGVHVREEVYLALDPEGVLVFPDGSP